jgi:hypothetical protein
VRTLGELILDGLANHDQGSPDERLWLAVIDSAIAEWVCGPMRHKRKAEYFLSQDEEDCPFVCRSAGLIPEHVRETLWVIRAQSASASNTTVTYKHVVGQTYIALQKSHQIN